MAESAEPRWREASPWRIDSVPVVSIGTANGPDETNFSDIAAVLRLSDGRLVVSDRGSAQIRFFSPDGQFERAVGGRGDGPGEFRVLGTAALTGGDTVVAADGLRPRLTIIDPTTGDVGTADLAPHEGATPMPMAISRTGAVLGVLATPFGQTAATQMHDSVALVAYASRTAAPTDAGKLNWGERWLAAGAERPSPVTFTAPGLWAPAAEGFVTSGGTSHELRFRRADGAVQRVVRWAGPIRSVDDTVRRRFREHELGRAADSEARRRTEQQLRDARFAATLPTHRAILVDEQGFAWVERYRAPWEDERWWTVIDADGEWLGDIRLPDQFMPTHIGAEFLAGVWTMRIVWSTHTCIGSGAAHEAGRAYARRSMTHHLPHASLSGPTAPSRPVRGGRRSPYLCSD